MAELKGLLNESELKAATKAARLAARYQEGLDLRGLVENRRKALEVIANRPLTTTLIPIPMAFEINRKPLNIPFAEHLEPGNNWAQIDFEMGYSRSGQVDVWFQFGWQNPSNSSIVITAECALVLKGIGRAQVAPAPFHGGHARLNLFGQLDVTSGQLLCPGPQITIDNSPFVNLDSGPTMGGGGDIGNHEPYSGRFDLRNDAQILVDACDNVVVSAHFWATYDVDYGQVVLNFSASDNSIMCPGALINLLSPLPVNRA
jgi:hypothetical protein